LESVKTGTDFTLYGNDYPTQDGTCVRDYVHVEDLAAAHIMAMDSKIPSDVYNLGTNQGHSNLQILQGAMELTGKNLNYGIGTRREGDPAMLTADAGKFMSVSGWTPKFNLHDMIGHAWTWYNQ
jgi:UDP-glucose 4-epimerase